jgi:glycosyltransferase involved in cell wall biosynthesis
MRNEESSIEKSLLSLINQDYPMDRVEIIVVDGISNDASSAIVAKYSRRYSNIRLLINKNKTVPYALNIGIRNSIGGIIVRTDAHTYYSPDYVSKCVKYLTETDAACVGGPMRANGLGIIGETIAAIHHCTFGLGGGKFHKTNFSGYVDTVYLGVYRRCVFEDVGLFDERLTRNQDIEFNSRLRKKGYKIFLTYNIKSYYRCRNTFKGFMLQSFMNGLWNVRTMKIAPGSLSVRHFVPTVFVLSIFSFLVIGLFGKVGNYALFALFGIYLLLCIIFAFVCGRKMGVNIAFLLPFLFFMLHFSYGLGSICGLLIAWKNIV